MKRALFGRVLEDGRLELGGKATLSSELRIALGVSDWWNGTVYICGRTMRGSRLIEFRNPLGDSTEVRVKETMTRGVGEDIKKEFNLPSGEYDLVRRFIKFMERK